MINLYCGINETEWNHRPVSPGPLACISPVYGRSTRTRTENRVRVPAGTNIIQDSGAFSDSWGERLGFEAALKRQVTHAEKYGYAEGVTHRATYDVLIDEVWVDGNRAKRRWSEADAEAAVLETIQAAAYLHTQRGLVGHIVSAQGVTASQYMACAMGVLPYLVDTDMFGLGGWCIIGKMRKIMMPVFRDTMTRLIPFLGREGVKRVHIWGVIMPAALGGLLWLCDQHNIALSTDSAGPSVHPCFGEWGYGDWRDRNYIRPPVSERGDARASHVKATREWLLNLRNTRYYREMIPPIYQLTFFA